MSQSYVSIHMRTETGSTLTVNMTLTEIATTIPAHAVEVHLSMNKITHIAANGFSNLAQCTKLDLGWNEISGIEPDAFKWINFP